MGEMKPLSNTVIILIIAKICGRVSASRLHKIVYILKMKYHIPLNVDYQTSPSIYSSDLDYTLGVLVAFGLLDVQIISRREYIDRIYKVTEKRLRMLEDALKDEDTERMFNQLEFYIRELGELPLGELAALAKTFIHNTIQKI
jgi:hypothetical protein